MLQSLRSQFFVPLFTTIVVAVAFVSATAYWYANVTARKLTEERIASVSSVIANASFPLTGAVLNQMSSLASLELMIVQSDNRISNRTQGLDGLNSLQSDWTAATLSREIGKKTLATKTLGNEFLHDVPLAEHRWDVGISQLPAQDLGMRSFGAVDLQSRRTLVVLARHEFQERLAKQALYLPIATGGVSALAVGAVAILLATRIGGRIKRLGDHVSEISLGNLEQLAVTGPNDAIAKLTEDMNHMTQQLKLSQKAIASNQRSMLINQFASGMAHQLRNTLTGARLAIQMYQQQYCLAPTHVDNRQGLLQPDTDLDLALDQLSLAEQSIQSLLQVRTGPDQAPSPPQEVISIMMQLVGLIQSKAEHREIELVSEIQNGIEHCLLPDGQAILGAILNLALNGIEAMNAEGTLKVTAGIDSSVTQQAICRFVIADSGPGPTQAIQPVMMESFSTTKPEGIGIGLPMAQGIAKRLKGSLLWNRLDGWTTFCLSIPFHPPIQHASEVDEQ